MVREYRQVTRRQQVQATRDKVLDAAEDLFCGSSFHPIGLEHIADAAGVGRATVYRQFKSKLGLLRALNARASKRARFSAVIEAVRHPDPVEALRGFLFEKARFWAAERAAFSTVMGIAATDEEVASFVGELDKARRRVVLDLIRRLEHDAFLRKGLSRADAVETLMMLSGFHTYDQLSQGGSQSIHAGRRISDIADKALLHST